MASFLNKLSFITKAGIRSYHRNGRRYMIKVLKAHNSNKRIAGPQNPIPRRLFSPWNYDAELFAFSTRINEQFDINILKKAFLDSSFTPTEDIDLSIPDLSAPMSEDVSETNQQVSISEDNSELSKEGEIICKNYIQKFLKQEYPLLPEEGIQVVIEFLMSEEKLSESSLGIGTKELILAEKYPPPKSVTVKAFKALIGAVKKCQSQEKAELFIRDFVVTHLANNHIEDLYQIPHPFATLKQIFEKEGKPEPEPRLQWQAGYNTLEACFQVGIYCDKELIGESAGETPEIAVDMAALNCLFKKYGIYNKVLNFE